MRAGFIKGLLAVVTLFALVFSVEFYLEWDRLGRPGMSAMSWEGTNNAKLVDLLSPMARAYNNILAMLIATVGLAIPLTANMHTPKLIDMFLRDRVNQLMLGLFAFGAAHVLWAAYLVGPSFAPSWPFRLSVFGAMLGWALLIPYFFYVVRFLDPSNIIVRLKRDVLATFEAAEAGTMPLEAAQDVLHERLYQIGTIVLKSIDRADRSVALEGIWTLKQILDRYGERKVRMPDGWFRVDRRDFVGLSSEAIELLNEERTWVEMKTLTQLYLGYQHALAKTADAISSISDANRVVAVAAAKRGDQAALALSVRFFNNFLREAIKRKDPHGIYDIFYQYRLLAREMVDRPPTLRAIARYFRTYSDLALANGLPFIPQLAGFDLGAVAEEAYRSGSDAAGDVLGEVLALRHVQKGEPALLLVKAKVILGGFFVESGLEPEATRLVKNLADVPHGVLDHVEGDLLGAVERSYWEVTDRQVNLEYVPPARREHVRAFLNRLRNGEVRAESA